MQWIMCVCAISLFIFNLQYVSSEKGSSHEYRGIFDSFLEKFIFLLSGGKEKHVKEVCKIFEIHLKSMRYEKYTKKLAKKFKNLSRMDQEEIMSELTEYTDALRNKSDKLIAFLEAINAAFTAQQRQQFEDYLNDMEDYIRGAKLLIQKETETLLNDVILKSILRLSKRDQVDLKYKLKRVIKEHKDCLDVGVDLKVR